MAGEGKWIPTRSAYELAYAWHGANGIPVGIREAFASSGFEDIAGLRLEIGFVEKPTFLDTPIGPSMTDIMGYARNKAGAPVILAIEGKATESFGLPVRSWVRGDVALPESDAQPRESRLRRLSFLAERLGIEVDADSPLYYQLLHRAVSGVMEAVLHGAACAVLVVHSFAEADQMTWQSYSAFLAALGFSGAEKNRVSGPVTLAESSGMRLYALWYQDRPRAQP